LSAPDASVRSSASSTGRRLETRRSTFVHYDLASSAIGELVNSMLALSPDARLPAAAVARALASFADTQGSYFVPQ
jgi:hypothetical protein